MSPCLYSVVGQFGGLWIGETGFNALDVFDGFQVWRDASMLSDGFRAGVIGSQCQFQVPKFHQQVFQVLGTGMDVLCGIEGISDVIVSDRCRHELHESDGAFSADGPWIAA